MQFPEYRPGGSEKMKFPQIDPGDEALRGQPDLPLFVVPGAKVKKPIASMPGNFQMSVDHIVRESARMKDLGFPRPALRDSEKKDENRFRSGCQGRIIQQAVREIKAKVPDILVITDVCLCEYMSHGHCGMIEKGEVVNDLTLEVLAEQAVSHAKAGRILSPPRR